MFGIGLALLVACVCASTVISQSTDAGYICAVSSNDPPKMSISSSRNQTGHLISQVGFQYISQHQSALVANETPVWRVEVEQRAKSCEGIGRVTDLVFTIIAPYQLKPLPSDYEPFPGIGYYKFHTDVATWPRAREICAEEDAHLIIINSEKESDVTKTMFAKHLKIPGASNDNYAWVGVREIEGVNGQYVTIHGAPLNSTGFTRWAPGEPNNVTPGDFMLVHRVTGGLADVPAALAWKVAFICQYEL